MCESELKSPNENALSIWANRKKKNMVLNPIILYHSIGSSTNNILKMKTNYEKETWNRFNQLIVWTGLVPSLTGFDPKIYLLVIKGNVKIKKAEWIILYWTYGKQCTQTINQVCLNKSQRVQISAKSLPLANINPLYHIMLPAALTKIQS